VHLLSGNSSSHGITHHLSCAKWGPALRPGDAFEPSRRAAALVRDDVRRRPQDRGRPAGRWSGRPGGRCCVPACLARAPEQSERSLEGKEEQSERSLEGKEEQSERSLEGKEEWTDGAEVEGAAFCLPVLHLARGSTAMKLPVNRRCPFEACC